MSNDHVLFEIDGPLAILTFNRPEARNAMTFEMYEALVKACDEVESNPDIRVFILRGAGGKAFVAGTDISQFSHFRTAEDGIAYETRIDKVMDRLEKLGKPTICQVQGFAVGGGAAIAMCCDIRICTPESKFGVPIARTLGNCLSVANYGRLVDLMGPARTKEVLFTGRLIGAEEAASLGMVNKVVSAEELEGAVREMATTIAANAPLTIKASKELVRRVQAKRRIDAAEGHDMIVMCYTSEDFKEGVEAFLSKRPPQWKGK